MLVGYSGAKQIGAFGKPNDQRLIQRELMARGPVTVVFRLTEDFYMHESGIFYVRTGCHFFGRLSVLAGRICNWR